MKNIIKSKKTLAGMTCLCASLALAQFSGELPAHADGNASARPNPGSIHLERAAGKMMPQQLALAPITLGNGVMATNPPMTMVSLPSYDADQPLMDFDPSPYSVEVVVKSGDSLSTVLMDAGVTAGQADEAARAARPLFDPRRLMVGQKIQIQFKPVLSEATDLSPERQKFLGFSLHKSLKTDVVIRQQANGSFSAGEQPRAINQHAERASGVIDSSLYTAGRKAGMPAAILAKLIQAYSWEVDFQREIREGDSFEVFYDTFKDDSGRIIESGNILYATLRLSGDDKTIYRFEHSDGTIGYYDEKGHSTKRALMRTPIDGARLSSSFGRRKHPVLGYTKMHRGVDFAAPRGTPIYAAGDGVVERASRWSSFGNYIRIRHNGTYSTAYAHLNGFAKGVRKGKRVRQGQVIGYVGTTGRSTGPHLHYEILKNGGHVNPMRIKMPSGEKLKEKPLKNFMAAKAALDLRIASLRATDHLTTASRD